MASDLRNIADVSETELNHDIVNRRTVIAEYLNRANQLAERAEKFMADLDTIDCPDCERPTARVSDSNPEIIHVQTGLVACGIPEAPQLPRRVPGASLRDVREASMREVFGPVHSEQGVPLPRVDRP